MCQNVIASNIPVFHANDTGRLPLTAPTVRSRSNHMYDQTALTLALRRHNYSSCLPRETHCTSAVKKVSWDAFASSHPIVVASRWGLRAGRKDTTY